MKYRNAGRAALGLALSAAVALGVAAPAAQAAPKNPKAVAASTKAKPVKPAPKNPKAAVAVAKAKPAPKPVAAAKPAPKPAPKVDQKLVQAKDKVTREIVRKDGDLAKVLTSKQFGEVSTARARLVKANVTADRAVLAQYKTQVTAATTVAAADAVGAKVANVRTEVYSATVNQVRDAEKQIATVLNYRQAVLPALTEQADALEAQGGDVTAVRAALRDATRANNLAAVASRAAADAAVTARASLDGKKVVSVVDGHLRTTKTNLVAVATYVAKANEALAAVVLPVVDEDPVVDQPVDEDPVDEDPIVEDPAV